MKRMKTGSRKFKWRRFAAAAGAGLSAAVVLITAVLGRSIDAQAADTLMGIERLRTRVKESGREYVILEIVPDINEAEIGYLVDGYEPILSEWDPETGEWKSWKDIFCDKPSENDRRKFIDDAKGSLRDYYDQVGMSSSAVPVVAAEETYVECNIEAGESTDGYEAITASGYQKTGSFAPSGAGQYLVSFMYNGRPGNPSLDYQNVQYYVKIGEPIKIDDEVAERLKDKPDTLIYSQDSIEKDVFIYEGKWGDVNRAVMSYLDSQPLAPDVDEDEPSIEDEPGADELPDDSDADNSDDDNNNPDDTENPDENNGNPDDTKNPDENNGNQDDTKNPDDSSNNPNSGDITMNGKNNVLSASANINLGRWFLLAGENVSEGSDDSDTPSGGDENKGDDDSNIPSDDNKNDGDGDSKDSDDDEDDGDSNDPSGDGGDAGDDEISDDDNIGQDSSEESSSVPVLGASPYASSNGPYYIVTFERVDTYYQAGEDSYKYKNDAFYSVIGIEPNEGRNENSSYIFNEYKDTSSDKEGNEDGEDGKIDWSTYEPRQTYTFPGRTIYCKNTFKSNEWFRNYVLNMDPETYADFPIKVVTLTPTKLKNMLEEGSLPYFDFLYLSSGLGAAAGKEGNSNEDGEGDDSDTGDTDPDIGGNGSGSGNQGDDSARVIYDVDNDIDNGVLQALYATVVAGMKPCLVDGSILYAQGEGNAEGVSGGTVVNKALQDTNIFRLAAMLCQENFGGNYDGMSNAQLVAGIVDDDDKNFVVEHVYCRYGNGSIINSLFSTPTIYADTDTVQGEVSIGFQSVLDEINLDNLYRSADSSNNYNQLSTDISQATVIRHIINYADRRKVETKKHIRVLEIQPAKADQPELTLAKLQEWAPGVESADITVMTTAEFIGKIEKLNENYDLIYIGTSKDHLNMRYWTNKSYTGKPDANHPAAGTVFNDSDMDGLIYYNIGDLRGASMQLAGQLDSEYVNNDRNNNVYYYNYMRYGGNDITEEKKEALLSFLDGSYPVIVADDFFEQPVTVYATPGYKEGRVSLPEGEYDYYAMVAAGIAGADISSVKVKEGYQITLYNGWYFEDNPNGNRFKVSFKKDESDFNKVDFGGYSNWNNKPNSLKVERLPDATPTRTIDEDHIDNCTYMYEFVKQAMEKKYVNFYAWSDITDDSELFKFYLNRPKVSMADFLVNGNTKDGSDVHYIESGSNGRYNLVYSFAIRNEGAASYNTRYECKLYIDINSDGKFSPMEEVGDISLTQGGGYVSWDNLYADRTYVLTREIPAGYKGLLPWRVEITQADNPNIYTSMTGYTKLEGMEQEKITVLQITRDRGDWEPNKNQMLDLGKEIETENTIYNTLVHGGTYDGVTYEGIDKDYDIDVTFKTISEYEKIFYGGEYQAEDEDAPSVHEPNPNYLEGFNMLILGFDDMYGDIRGNSTEGAMGAIVDFINSGKSVLLSHDTTSYFQYTWGMNATTGRTNRDDSGSTAESPDGPFAYSMNQYIRPLVGMDRYGILTSDILKKGNTLSEGSSEFAAVIGSRYDKAYKPKSARLGENNELIKTQLVPQVHGYTYIVINGKDYDTTRGDDPNKGGYDKLTFSRRELDLSQADNWTFNNTYRNIRYDQVFYQGGDSDFGELSIRRGSNTYGEVDNLWVTQVNQGQITEYPYKLPKTFEIAETHGQYYQLDYTADDDGDGESDLVVWFCLGKRGDQETIYSQSPNDVRNNYYIYNKGNITYTGMGHSVSDISHNRNPDYTLDEAKLFINTMIAAYQAGIKDPYISVLKTGTVGSEELKALYRFYDRRGDTDSLNYEIAQRTQQTPQSYEKVYFTVQDINFIKGSRKIATHVYYKIGEEAGTVPITVDGEEITVTPLPDEIYKASDGSRADADNLQSGGIYYILVPSTVMDKCENGLNFYFEAQSTLTTSTTKENVYVTDKVYAKLQVLQAYMFNLE